MPYIVRNEDGNIVSIHGVSTPEACEELAPEDPELRAFLGQNEVKAKAHRDLEDTDRDFVRVLEDLLTVLINKNVIMLTDLPEAAQRKVIHRQGLRCEISDLGNILSDSDDLPLS